ncbi:MAG: hypothetical protein OXI43_01580 [Candidatus Poribacteria bacterium]|nr:hypothetical protein [Candidatus Poribacteria bacterium]
MRAEIEGEIESRIKTTSKSREQIIKDLEDEIDAKNLETLRAISKGIDSIMRKIQSGNFEVRTN